MCLHGKGGKVRICPLWASTTITLRNLVVGRNLKERVFLNRRSEPLTRFGIHEIVTRYARAAMNCLPPSSLTDPDVQISRIRFLVEEICSPRRIGERSLLKEEGNVGATPGSASSGNLPAGRAVRAASSISSQPDGRTNAIDGHCL